MRLTITAAVRFDPPSPAKSGHHGQSARTVRWVDVQLEARRTTEWSVVPLPTLPDKFRWPDMTRQPLRPRQLTAGLYLWWFPVEVNVTILANALWSGRRENIRRARPSWSISYYTSVGRNANLIFNFCPTTAA